MGKQYNEMIRLKILINDIESILREGIKGAKIYHKFDSKRGNTSIVEQLIVIIDSPNISISASAIITSLLAFLAKLNSDKTKIKLALIEKEKSIELRKIDSQNSKKKEEAVRFIENAECEVTITKEID